MGRRVLGGVPVLPLSSPLVPLPPPPRAERAGLGVTGGSFPTEASNPGTDGAAESPGPEAGRGQLAPMHVFWSSPSS